MLRPERIPLGAADGARAAGTVQEVQYFGAFTRIKVDVGGSVLQADLAYADAAPQPGQPANLHWDARAVHALAASA